MSSRTSIGALLGVVLIAAGCGLPTDGVETVDDGSVPYHLLDDGGEPSAGDEGDGPGAGAGPVVFWVDDDEQLVPRRSMSECAGDVADVLDGLLDELTAGPVDEFRDQGLATAIPPESAVELTEVADGVVSVDLRPQSQISPSRLPVAIAQVVLTVTSVPGVDDVALASDGEPLQVPIAGGALTSSPVTADDYAALVPTRFADSAPFTKRDGGGPCPS